MTFPKFVAMTALDADRSRCRHFFLTGFPRCANNFAAAHHREPASTPVHIGRQYVAYSTAEDPMPARKSQKVSAPQKPNLGRHQSACRICTHAQHHEIEREFISWKSAAQIAIEYELRDRSTVYRHAHAFDLYSKRARNIRAALERIIEKVDDVEVNAGAVVQAIATYARMNSRGQLVEQNAISFHDLFDRMNRAELEAYARDGVLPEWFTRAMGATTPHGPEGDGNG